MSGDLDYDKTIAMINKYFGGYELQGGSCLQTQKESPITSVKRSEVWGRKLNICLSVIVSRQQYR